MIEPLRPGRIDALFCFPGARLPFPRAHQTGEMLAVWLREFGAGQVDDKYTPDLRHSPRAANHMKPATVLKAVHLIKTGEIIELGHTLAPNMPFFGTRRFDVHLKRTFTAPRAGNVTARSGNEEVVITEIGHVGTQFDAFPHQTIGDTMYNCVKNSETAGRGGFSKLGVDKVGAIFTRGVLIDVASFKGVEMLDDNYEITAEDLKGALAKQGTTLAAGDAVVIHTGWGKLWAKDNPRFVKSCPGIGVDAATWLADQDPILIGSDNWPVEVFPNLLPGDLWKSDVVVTTSRGAGNTLAMAEYAVAGILHFARGLRRAAVGRAAGRFEHRHYLPLLVAGKTVCIVGVGGIGREVGRLCAALGMVVVGTRRWHAPGTALPAGFVEVAAAAGLDTFLPTSDFVVICCQWRPETTHLFNQARFALMKPEVVLVNVARGEIFDEAALVDAFARNRLRGAVLDVYDGEFERPPTAGLWTDPRVLITPHISGGSDLDAHGGIDVFCENLRAFLAGQPLRNVIDWDRGY